MYRTIYKSINKIDHDYFTKSLQSSQNELLNLESIQWNGNELLHNAYQCSTFTNISPLLKVKSQLHQKPGMIFIFY